MRKTLLLLLAVVLTAGAATAGPVTLTFDDLPGHVVGPGAYPVVPTGYGGLNWTNFAVVDGTDSAPTGYHNGVVSPKMAIFDLGGDPASLGGNRFTFTSAYFTAAWNDGLQIAADGYLGGNLVDSTQFAVNTTAPTLETFNWPGIDKVTFTSSGGTLHPPYTGSGTQFVMDNVTFTATPEPSTFVLIGAAAIGLLASAWYRRK